MGLDEPLDVKELDDELVWELDDEWGQQVLADDAAVQQVSDDGELVREQDDILEQVGGTVLELDVEQGMLPSERAFFNYMLG